MRATPALPGAPGRTRRGGSSATGDRHVLVVQQSDCKLYEMYNACPTAPAGTPTRGAVWDLTTGALRPLRLDLRRRRRPADSSRARALRRSRGRADHTRPPLHRLAHAEGFHPPGHTWASSSTATNLPPMGLRLRLKASFDTSKYTGETRVVLEALKTYGMIVADNGSNFYISGATDSRWNDTDLNQLKGVPGSAFEVVQTGVIQH